jgi:hypothetical protein
VTVEFATGKFEKPLDIFFEVYYNIHVVNAKTGNCPAKISKESRGLV